VKNGNRFLFGFQCIRVYGAVAERLKAAVC
jgi:hypothetical protein